MAGDAHRDLLTGWNVHQNPGSFVRLFLSLVQHRGWWTGLTLLVLAAALALASRLTLRSDLQDFLPQGQALADPLAAGSSGSGVQRDRILVVLEGGGPMAAAEVAPALDALSARLRALPGVRRVEYRLGAELRQFAEREGAGRALLYLTPRQIVALGDRLSREGLERILLRQRSPASLYESLERAGLARQDPLGMFAPALGAIARGYGGIGVPRADGYFAAPGLRAFFLILEPAHPILGVDGARALVLAIEDVLHEVSVDPAYERILAGRTLAVTGLGTIVL